MGNKDKTIKIRIETVEKLENHREHKRETWDDLINKLLELVEGKDENR